MSVPGQGRCSVCGRQAQLVSIVPGVGDVCEECLLAGRFLGSTGAPRFLEAARDLPKLSPEIVLSYAPDLLADAQRLMEAGDLNGARQLLIEKATFVLSEGKPLLAAFFLKGALGIQGYSANVYATLGDAARAADCQDDAARHYKTAGWLAMKLGDRLVLERVLAGIKEVRPDDAWIKKASDWLKGEHEEGEPSCGFCGKSQSEVGPLIKGPQAAICSQCLKSLSQTQSN